MKTLAMLVGGGPAPGINGVIAAATIEARNHGVRVLGLYDGFKWLARGDTAHVTELEIAGISRIHFEGVDPADVQDESDQVARDAPQYGRGAG
ncbi:MAG: 6-phosphofructokinase [Candidatus Methylomirabilis sp.]|nr:6-phosphofructokinase [Candidatus Methylomirabilis sp.]